MKIIRTLVVSSSVLIILGLSIGWIGFPAFLRKMIKGQVTLKPGSETRKMWEKFPFPLIFKVYVFNVSNPNEVQMGEKPILKEVGPFVFEEWKDKYNLEDNDVDDTVTFNMRNTYYFQSEMSNGLTGEELIIMPHPLIQIIAISIKREKAPMLPMVAKGLEEIFQPSSPFITTNFMDLFFRGIPVDCSSKNFEATTICIQFHTGEVKGGVAFNETHFKFSLMGGANHTDAGKFKVSRGVKESRDVGRVIEFQDEDEQSVWDGDECNKFEGTDSTIFPPLMTTEDKLSTFSGDVCRSLGPKYEKSTTYDGIPTKRFTLDFGDLKNEPQNYCFCKDFPNDCPLKGTMDISACSSAPMIISMPHFYKGDPILLENVIGLHPNQNEHELFIDMETMTGTPLSLAKRLQFNLDVEPISEVEVMKNLRKVVMPMFWVEESANLNKTFTDLLKKSVILAIKVDTIFKWMTIILGLAGLALAALLSFNNSQRAVQVEPTQKPSFNSE